jgi:hypothetical protein
MVSKATTAPNIIPQYFRNFNPGSFARWKMLSPKEIEEKAKHENAIAEELKKFIASGQVKKYDRGGNQIKE